MEITSAIFFKETLASKFSSLLGHHVFFFFFSRWRKKREEEGEMVVGLSPCGSLVGASH